MDIVGLTAVVLSLGIPIYAIYRGYNQSDDKVEARKLYEQRRLEEIKQENYLLENESMRIELEKIKKERELREQKAIDAKENRRWLIEDKKEEEEI